MEIGETGETTGEETEATGVAPTPMGLRRHRNSKTKKRRSFIVGCFNVKVFVKKNSIWRWRNAEAGSCGLTKDKREEAMKAMEYGWMFSFVLNYFVLIFVLSFSPGTVGRRLISISASAKPMTHQGKKRIERERKGNLYEK